LQAVLHICGENSGEGFSLQHLLRKMLRQMRRGTTSADAAASVHAPETDAL